MAEFAGQYKAVLGETLWRSVTAWMNLQL